MITPAERQYPSYISIVLDEYGVSYFGLAVING